MQSQLAGYIDAVRPPGQFRRRRRPDPNTDLFLVGLGHHVARHVPDALVDDFCHRGHDPFGLLSIQPFSF